jgi:hypothetical protein
MSTKEIVVSAVQPPVLYTDDAQGNLQDLRQMRKRFPHFVMPTSATETHRLSSAASVPPEFIEIANVAVTNENALVRGEASTPAEVRDLVQYAAAYEPVADELEALAHFVRHSVIAAKNKAGTEALTTYALAQRLAKRPEGAHLAPYVADMRRALGRARKVKAEAKKAAQQQTPPVPTQES